MLSKEVDEKIRKFTEISRNKKIKNKFNWVGVGGRKEEEMELISYCMTAIKNIDKQIAIKNKEEERSWRKKGGGDDINAI